MAMLGSFSCSQAFQLKSDLQFEQQMKPHIGPQGGLQTDQLSPSNLKILNAQLKVTDFAFKEHTKACPDTFSSILDSGASWHAVNKISMCKPGSLRKLATPIILNGIAGGHKVEYSGILDVETLDKAGSPVPFEITVMVNEQLPCVLISPQALLKECRTQNDDCFSIFHNRIEWIISGTNSVTINYDAAFLPRLTIFQRGKAKTVLHSYYSVFHDTNKNLSWIKRLWLKWHVKLGHLSFSHVLSLATRGHLDREALGLSEANSAEHPFCASCKQG